MMRIEAEDGQLPRNSPAPSTRRKRWWVGTDQEWFLTVDRRGEKRDEQERGWLIARHEEVKDIVERLRAL